ncbi:MAG: hypothetical protein ACK5DM_09460 [Planctomyces sp.]
MVLTNGRTAFVGGAGESGLPTEIPEGPNNKEGVFYTLSDVYQPGTYTVSYYFKKETGFIATYSILTYGQTGFLNGQPNVGGANLEQGSLPFAYQLVTYTATVAAGSAAIG